MANVPEVYYILTFSEICCNNYQCTKT